MEAASAKAGAHCQPLLALAIAELARAPRRSGDLLGSGAGVPGPGVDVSLRADPGRAVARLQRPGDQGLRHFRGRLRPSLRNSPRPSAELDLAPAAGRLAVPVPAAGR